MNRDETGGEPVEPMEEDRAWRLILVARMRVDPVRLRDEPGANAEELLAGTLRHVLSPLDARELLAFEHRCHRLRDDANRWDLRDAATVLGGDGSDEAFHAFRTWLIGRGPVDYQAVLADPQALVDILRRDPRVPPFEPVLGHVVAELFLEQADEDLPPPPEESRREPAGEHREGVDFRTRYPRLAALGEELTARSAEGDES
ncbi:MAG: DUF4240 domain-containing protein [Acidobacteriota bacterium]